METVLQKNKECWVCGSPSVEDHHIFFGQKTRSQSEKYGLKLWLCPEHHRIDPHSPHKNRRVDLAMKITAQKHFETYIGTHEEFMAEFGRNYLDDIGDTVTR
jgi:hypothetical protein